MSVFVVSSLLQVAQTPQSATALSGADFQAGNIISDQNFFDSGALTESQIQTFLQSQPCTPLNGVPCLKDFTQSTPTVAAVGGTHCKAYSGGTNERASRIIAKVAAACQINPKALLVLLQKEQSLVTRPSAYGYQRAMGWGCPDSGPNYSANCDANFFGFFNQTYKSAWQFRQYTEYPVNIPGGGTRAYRIGTVYIQNNPNPACGGSNVTIENQATANLYLYTPYQPNAAALANLKGTGDQCSSYGNRNFWQQYTDWFGPTTGHSLSPVGNVEIATASVASATFRGWAFDPEIPGPIAVHLYLNGQWGGAFDASVPRQDIAQAYPSYGSNHGFAFSVPLAVGAGSVEACLYAINVGAGSNQLLACETVTTPTGSPLGSLDSATLGGGNVVLSGWVIDPDSPASTTVHAYVNGAWGGAFPADGVRADVGRAYPGYGSNHGFSANVNVGVGTSNICVYGINIGGGDNKLIECKSVSTGSGPPIGNIESATASAGRATLNGWALDPDSPASIDVHAYVNGQWGGSFTANVSRADVGRAYPGYGDTHGFSANLPVPGGTSKVCLYGINVQQGYNSSLGCSQVYNPSGSPFGNFESALTGSDGTTTISGWSIDPDTTLPVDVHVYFNGQWGGSFTADAARGDVSNAFPAFGPEHGFSIPVTLDRGSNQICLYSISVGAGANQDMGCKTVLK
ncbi:hypothetical protein [Cryobacterium sp. TMS1-13-1]|uniref:hypothetical protein n=1 Tax=Cryobacterium sp. TMS1-13-1 TaxID=1259220 RepID=UPI0011019ECD|nr:hypothetical protein [Cryobacterium sp. TMS1-13-1]TFD19503.1 hypothetical protein E3T31_15335 [Cryobacterium sp. TMS1-13-1]